VPHFSPFALPEDSRDSPDDCLLATFGSELEDPAHPGHYKAAACGAYRWSSGESLLRAWNRSIPLEDKGAWRDPAVAKAYVEAALASDPKSQTQHPPALRSPCGALEDSFYLATGRQLWDGSLVTAPTLILAAEKDFWSRPEDRQNLAADLVHAAKVLWYFRARHILCIWTGEIAAGISYFHQQVKVNEGTLQPPCNPDNWKYGDRKISGQTGRSLDLIAQSSFFKIRNPSLYPQVFAMQRGQAC